MSATQGRVPYAYTPETLAELWGVSSATVRNLIRAGELRAFHIGRQIRIRPEWVVAYEDRQASLLDETVMKGPPPRPFIPTGL